MKNIYAVAILAGVCTSSDAQYTRQMLDVSDVAVVGTITALSDGGVSQSVRIDTGDLIDTFPVVIAEVETISIVKGTVREKFRLALPANLTYDAERPTANNHVFCIRQNQPFLFFLQVNGESGFFRTVRDRTSAYSTKWKSSSADYAPVWLSGTATQYWMSVRSGAGTAPVVKLANLLISSALADATSRSASLLRLAQDISPLSSSMVGSYKDAEGTDLRECLEWRDSSLPALLGQTSSGVLNTLAIQITWGRRELSAEFTTKFLSAKPADLEVSFPQFLETSDRLRLLRHPEPIIAAQQFGNVILFEPLKREIAVIGIPRFGESRDLDIAILNCLSRLYERPDISPYDENKKPKENLENEITLARRLGG
ncbi:MAG: hypothetical protein U0R49_12380 [Fimbriimonadales bacterium]